MKNQIIHILIAVVLSLFAGGSKILMTGPEWQGRSERMILEAIDVAPVWSVHQIGSPELLTIGKLQYVAYYDKERFLTLAQRDVNSESWSTYIFPVQMGWATGGHAQLSLAVDRDGYIHLASYRRSLIQGPPAPPQSIYYRSLQPHDISGFERLVMISDDEAPAYPTFIKGPAEELYFTYRQGSSGRGNQIFNLYDHDRRKWDRLYDTPLFDGQDKMNAYGGPSLGLDGFWHATWVWRHTPCNSTNHYVSYARSSDMRNWETIDGRSITLPITNETEGVVVDPAGPGDGILRLQVWSRYRGEELIVLDEKTLNPLSIEKIKDIPEWRLTLEKPELDFAVMANEDLLRTGGSMQVSILEDKGKAPYPGVRYVLRWEHAGGNRDRPVPEPWPQPTMLRGIQDI